MKGALLWKRILNEGFLFDDGSQLQDYEATVRQILTAPIIVAGERNLEDYQLKQFTEVSSCSIPFPVSWIEGTITEKDGATGLWGNLATFRKDDAGFTGEIVMFQCSLNSRPSVEGSMEFYLDSKGGFDNSRLKPSGFPCSYSTWMIEEHGLEKAQIAHRTNLRLVLDVLELLDCKNVGLQPHDADPKQVRRAIKRHGGAPDSYRYHTLVVRPPGAKSDSPGIDIGIMPRHVCRGHFAEYGPEFNKGLLFGKYAGRFYIPPHLKGKLENGRVEKDYEVREIQQ